MLLSLNKLKQMNLLCFQQIIPVLQFSAVDLCSCSIIIYPNNDLMLLLQKRVQRMPVCLIYLIYLKQKNKSAVITSFFHDAFLECLVFGAVKIASSLETELQEKSHFIVFFSCFLFSFLSITHF